MSISARRLQKVGPRTTATGTNPTANAGSVAVGAASYAVPGDAIYVATGGNDTTGVGTIGAPYRTLVRAITAATSGKTIVLRAGTYHEGGSNHTSAIGIEVNRNNLTIQNYPGEAVWFDGSSVQTGWSQSGATWSIPWTKVFDHSPTSTSGAADGSTPGWQWINANYPQAPFPEQVFVDGVALTQVGSLGACVAGTFYVQGTTSNMIFTPSTLYIGTNPAGKTVNVTDMHIFLNLGTGYTGLTIRGFGIRRYGNSLPQYSVLRFDGNNNTTNCLAENIVMEDIATAALTSNQCHGNTIRNVTIRRAGYRASGGYRSDNLLFDNILIEYTNTENFNSSPDSGVIKVTQSQHVTVRNSIFRDNKCKVVWFDMSVYDMEVYGNDFLRNKDTDAFFEISGTGICTNNLFVDNPAEAIKVNNTDNMEVWNNTIVRCGSLSQRLNPDTSNHGNGDRRPLAVYQESRRPANTSYGLDGRYPLGHAMYSSYMTWQINNVTIHNNVVVGTPSNAYAMFCIDDQQIQSGGTNQLLAAYGTVMDGNVFHWATAPSTTYPYPYIFPPTSVGSSTPIVYSTHAAMVSATSLNPNGTEINPKSSGTSNPSPIDANYVVTGGYAVLHTKAVALSASIAGLAGQPTGTKHAGCWRS
ncbi:right-handed parallel beta-helix repeat-containing protein [Candidatus Saccharibacteria bacterium]|nr:MAG: right-handed parallel beta-helix repeat-containing protein [Candidatus Saccharibacteria bacterium]